MDNRRLVIALTAILCALPPFAWTAHARQSRTPNVQDPGLSHAAPQSPGAQVRAHQRAKVAMMAETNARVKDRAEKLAREVEAALTGGNAEEGCRVLHELALALCASAREQERLITTLDQLLREPAGLAAQDAARERQGNIGTDVVTQHLGALVYSMSELVKAVEAMKPVLAP